MPPSLFINGRFLGQRQTGVQRFAREAVRAMDDLLGQPAHQALAGRVTLLVPPGTDPAALAPVRLRAIQVRMAGRFGGGYAWEQLDLPRLSAGGVLLNLCNLGPVAKRRQVVVVHDATPRVSPESFSLPFRLAYRVLVPMLGRAAAAIVTISTFSRAEISRWYGIPADRITVCGEGGDHILAQAADMGVLERHGLHPGTPGAAPYFLAVGVGSANKNVALVVDAFGRAGLDGIRLVMTGKRDPRVHPAGDGPAARRVTGPLCPVGHVSDGELRALYENALALVYPSRYEGFGLPPVEAMACGCPVIISDQPALVEVAAPETTGAALVCGVDDADGLARLLRRLAEDELLRHRLAANGRARAARFRWSATAEALLDACLGVARGAET
ncbi:glycosyltransferase family 4 protein [Nitrospirillum iridis]|uniref:Glycosyltransferase involved in cell wall biosynthesis n=1 Tax=Nitrospirillum iridis TaxID=765888 RepID=A0A7X0B0U1_9PROT|nr:glycosyltransferase family 1 protein [Nitrospirillum iridis]MBB6253673.1 glycosyltransferase involved in cell wall biosynthesis [Nitrospirillum iridis]